MAFTQLLSIGYVQTLVQNQVYALPACRVLLHTDAATPTIVQSDVAAFTTSTAITLVDGEAEVGGAFIKCTSAGPINVILKALS